LDAQGAEQNEVKVRTDGQGVAWFTIRFKQRGTDPAGGDAQPFEAWTINRDGEKQQFFVGLQDRRLAVGPA
jgi:hypothetical protein